MSSIAPAAAGKIKVLFLGGFGRSGSTLLDRLLGQLPGYVSVGEVRNLWERGLSQDQLCGCGQTFSGCPFWSEIMPAVARGAGTAGAPLALQRTVDRGRYIGRMLSPVRAPAFARALVEYTQLLARLYAAVAQTTGCKVIVDASKDPSHGFLLSMVPNVELHTIQLVRDSRAACFSWTRKKIRPEVHWKQEYMRTYPPMRAGLHWVARNLLIRLLGRYSHSYTLLRYEDFVMAPAATLQAVAVAIGEPIATIDFVCGADARVDAGHGIAGNPVRFDRGALTIRPDVEWRTKMKRRDRVVVSAMTLPLLARYGYVGVRRSSIRARSTAVPDDAAAQRLPRDAIVGE
jgi:Sulfotransferase family